MESLISNYAFSWVEHKKIDNKIGEETLKTKKKREDDGSKWNETD